MSPSSLSHREQNQLLAAMPYSEERGEALGVLLPTILAQGNDAAKAWAARLDR